MEIAHRWLDRRLSLLEGVVSWVFIIIVIGLFSRYMFIVFSKAEQSMINNTVININSAINYYSGIYLMQGNFEQLNDLINSNPIDIMSGNYNTDTLLSVKEFSGTLASATLFSPKPANYYGQVIDDNEPALEPGKWYFDLDNRFLFYRLSNTVFFNSELEGIERIRFKIRLNYTDNDKNNIFNYPEDDFISMKLEPMEQFTWSY